VPGRRSNAPRVTSPPWSPIVLVFASKFLYRFHSLNFDLVFLCDAWCRRRACLRPAGLDALRRFRFPPSSRIDFSGLPGTTFHSCAPRSDVGLLVSPQPFSTRRANTLLSPPHAGPSVHFILSRDGVRSLTRFVYRPHRSTSNPSIPEALCGTRHYGYLPPKLPISLLPPC